MRKVKCKKDANGSEKGNARGEKGERAKKPTENKHGGNESEWYCSRSERNDRNAENEWA